MAHSHTAPQDPPAARSTRCLDTGMHSLGGRSLPRSREPGLGNTFSAPRSPAGAGGGPELPGSPQPRCGPAATAAWALPPH